MGIHVKFKDLNDKKLGKFWKEAKDFYIEIDVNQPDSEKLMTFIEEYLHGLIYILKKSKFHIDLTLKKEHFIINEIINVLKKFGLL